MGFIEILLFGGVVVFVVMLFRWSSGSGAARALSSGMGYPGRLYEVAAGLGGTVVLQRSTVGGHVCWNRNGFPYFFYEKRTGESVWSVLSVKVPPGLLPTLQVRPREGAAPPLPALRLRPALDASSQFDGRFEVRVGDKAPDSLAPSPAACGHLLELADLTFPGSPVLEVHEDRVRLYVPLVLEDREKRAAVLSRGAMLLDTLLEEHVAPDLGSEVQFVDVLFTEGEGLETCQVCGETIRAQRVVCAKCATPHHRDCWQYTGVCAIFGCQCKQYR